MVALRLWSGAVSPHRVKIEGIMNGEMDRDILINNLSGEYADNLPLAWIFQQENDPKHTSKIDKSWLNQCFAMATVEPRLKPYRQFVGNS